MLRGFRGEEDGECYLVISSDDDGLDRFLALRPEIEEMDGRVPAAHKLLSDVRLRGFGHVYLFDDLDRQEINRLIGEWRVDIVSRVRALELHRVMREPQTNPDDRRPLREVLGLQDRDPWATPAPTKVASKSRDVTQDSFSDPTEAALPGSIASDWLFAIRPQDDKLMLRFALQEQYFAEGKYPGVFILGDLIRAGLPDGWLREDSANKFVANVHHEHPVLYAALTELGFVYNQSIWDAETDQTVEPFVFEVGDVREAVRIAKLFRLPLLSYGGSRVTVDASHAGNFAEVLERRRVAFQTTEELPEPAPVDVLARRPFRAFYRLDVTGLTLEAALVILAEAGINTDVSLLGWGETQHGIWFANAIERLAERHRDILVGEASGIETAIYRADTNGRRLDDVAAPVKETGPRPWKDGWAALAEEQRQSEIKSIEASEFLFTESRSGQDALFFFVPAEFYGSARGMWGGDLDQYINRFLPGGFKVSEPGVYRVASNNLDVVVFELCRAGFRESLNLRNWLNDQ